MLPLLSLLPLLPPLSGCELTEVTVPTGESRLIVQAVYSRGAPYQFVVVEDSRTGASTGSPLEPDEIPPEGPSLPLVGALVTLSYSAGSPCGGAVDTLPASAGADGLYRAEGLCIPDPGDVVSLRVVTPDGRVVTGSTVVPGAARTVVVAGPDTAVSDGAELLLRRDRDTVRIGVDAVSGRAMQVEARRPPSSIEVPVQDELVFYLILDSLGLALPGDLVNPFVGDEGERSFRAGTTYDLAIAVTDSNYYDFVRSRSDPFTGRGFINRLNGGIGVFGSVEVHRYRLRVVEPLTDPREGRYRVQGTLQGRTVDMVLELYVDEAAELRGTFAAFFEGTWLDGVLFTSADGLFYEAANGPQHLAAGFRSTTSDGEAALWRLEGVRSTDGTPFPLAVADVGPTGPGLAGTLTAVQVSGPAPGR